MSDKLSTLPFADQEWKTLSLAPVVAFLLVAAADGYIDDKEKQRFAELLKPTDNTRPASVQALFQHTAEQLSELLTRIATETVDMMAVISETGEILDRTLDHGEAQAFKQTLYDFAEQIAQSSGGLVAGNIDRHEAQTLEKIRQCLLLG